MTDSEQVREFFQRMANGITVSANSDLLHVRSNRLPRTTERSIDAVVDAEKDFGVGLPPLVMR